MHGEPRWRFPARKVSQRNFKQPGIVFDFLKLLCIPFYPLAIVLIVVEEMEFLFF